MRRFTLRLNASPSPLTGQASFHFGISVIPIGGKCGGAVARGCVDWDTFPLTDKILEESPILERWYKIALKDQRYFLSTKPIPEFRFSSLRTRGIRGGCLDALPSSLYAFFLGCSLWQTLLFMGETSPSLLLLFALSSSSLLHDTDHPIVLLRSIVPLFCRAAWRTFGTIEQSINKGSINHPCWSSSHLEKRMAVHNVPHARRSILREEALDKETSFSYLMDNSGL